MTRGVGKVVLPGVVALALLLAPAPAAAVGPCKGEDEPIVASNIDQAERSLLCLLNSYRAENGLDVLTHDPALQRAARGHSEDMVERGYFDHDSPEGEHVHNRATAEGYPEDSGVGENIAMDQRPNASPRTMFEGWRNSPGHDKNMLDPNWVNAGMGFATGAPPHPDYPGTSGTEEGATGTQVFGTAETEASDTASNLFVTEACTRAQTRKRRMAQRVRRARKAVRRADSARERKRTRQRVRRGVERLRRVRAEARSTCGGGF